MSTNLSLDLDWNHLQSNYSVNFSRLYFLGSIAQLWSTSLSPPTHGNALAFLVPSSCADPT